MFDVEAFVRAEFAKTAAPSSRSVKNKSGRTSRKQYHSRQALAAVGGTRSLTRAIYSEADRPLCVIVPNTTGWVGGVEDGTPYREPQDGQGRYYMGRGIN